MADYEFAQWPQGMGHRQDCCLVSDAAPPACWHHTGELQTAHHAKFGTKKLFLMQTRLSVLKGVSSVTNVLTLTSPMAASSTPAIEGGDMMTKECVSTIHSPAMTAGRHSTRRQDATTRHSWSITTSPSVPSHCTRQHSTSSLLQSMRRSNACCKR